MLQQIKRLWEFCTQNPHMSYFIHHENILLPLWYPLKLIWNKWTMSTIAAYSIFIKFPEWVSYQIEILVEDAEHFIALKSAKQDQVVKKFIETHNKDKEESGLENCKNDNYEIGILSVISYFLHHLPISFPAFMTDRLASMTLNWSGFYRKENCTKEELKAGNYLPMLVFIRSGAEFTNSIILIQECINFFGQRFNGFTLEPKRIPDFKNLKAFNKYLTVMTKLSDITISHNYEQSIKTLYYLRNLIVQYERYRKNQNLEDSTNKLESSYSEDIEYQILEAMFHKDNGAYQNAGYYLKIIREASNNIGPFNTSPTNSGTHYDTIHQSVSLSNSVNTSKTSSATISTSQSQTPTVSDSVTATHTGAISPLVNSSRSSSLSFASTDSATTLTTKNETSSVSGGANYTAASSLSATSSTSTASIYFWLTKKIIVTAERRKISIECEVRKCEETSVIEKQKDLLVTLEDITNNLSKYSNVLYPSLFQHTYTLFENKIKLYIDMAKISKNSSYLDTALTMIENNFIFGSTSIHSNNEISMICTIAKIMFQDACIKTALLRQKSDAINDNELVSKSFQIVDSYVNQKNVLLKMSNDSLQLSKNLYDLAESLNDLSFTDPEVSETINYYHKEIKKLNNTRESPTSETKAGCFYNITVDAIVGSLAAIPVSYFTGNPVQIIYGAGQGAASSALACFGAIERDFSWPKYILSNLMGVSIPVAYNIIAANVRDINIMEMISGFAKNVALMAFTVKSISFFFALVFESTTIDSSHHLFATATVSPAPSDTVHSSGTLGIKEDDENL